MTDLDLSSNVAEEQSFKRLKESFDIPELTNPEELTALYKDPALFNILIGGLDTLSVNTQIEVDFLNGIFADVEDGEIMDIACGAGRHAIGLAEKGKHIIGFDNSLNQAKGALEYLNALAVSKETKGSASFVNANANKLPFQKESFSGAFCMWSTLSEEPLNYEEVIPGIFDSLKPGAKFVVDVYNWKLKSGKPEHHEKEIDDPRSPGEKIRWEMDTRFDVDNKLRVRKTNIKAKGGSDTYVCVTHTFSPAEWQQILESNGFTNAQIYSDYKEGFDPSIMPERYQIVVEKP